MLRLVPTMILALLIAGPPISRPALESRAAGPAAVVTQNLDLGLKYEPQAGGYLRVTALFTGRNTATEPIRIVLQMLDGDAVTFAVPGYPDTRFSFRRTGDVVRAASQAL